MLKFIPILLLCGCSLGLPVLELDLEQASEKFIQEEIQKDQAAKAPVKEDGK